MGMQGGFASFIILSLMLFEFVKVKAPDLLAPISKLLPSNSLVATKVRPQAVDKNIPSLLDVPPQKMRKALDDAYRLRPDKRLLLSIGELHGFFTGEKKSEAIADYDNGLWKISYGGLEVGSLKENPDFPDFIRLLSGWIERLNASHPLPLSSASPVAPDIQAKIDLLEQFVSPDIIKNLHAVDQLWIKGEHRPILLYSSMRTLVFLSMQGLDEMGVADILSARALAFLALAKALTTYDTVREECLLADIMHYSGQAVKLAKLLPPNDATRAYILRDDGQLKTLAEMQDSALESRYFWLQRIAESGKWEDWSQWLITAFGGDRPSLPLLKTGLDMSRFKGKEDFSLLMGQIVLYQLLQEKLDVHLMVKVKIGGFLKNQGVAKEFYRQLGLETSTLSELTGIYESHLENMADEYQGPFFDRDTFTAYYQGYFYSMLYSRGMHYLDALSNVEMAQSFLEELKLAKSATPLAIKIKNLYTGSNHQPSIANFIRWYDDLVSSKAGNGNVQHLMEDMASLPAFGAKPLIRTMKEAKRYFKVGDPALLVSIKRMVFRLDNRPVHQYQLAKWGHWDLYDLRLAEKSYRYIADTDWPQQAETNLYYLSFIGQKDHLTSFLQDKGATVSSKLYALTLIESGNLGADSFLRKQYGHLVHDHPDNGRVRRQFARYLNKQGDYEQAREILRQWLDRKLFTEGLENTLFLNQIAETYFLQKRYKEGWEVIADSVSGMQGGTLRIAGKLLDKMGDKVQAENILGDNYSRYSHSIENAVPLIEFLWAHGRHEDAASALFSFKHPITSDEWRKKIVPSFSSAFKERSNEEVMMAFSSVLAHRADPTVVLSEFARGIYKSGNPKLAFEMQSRVIGRGLEQISLDFEAYKYLKAWKGEENALNWLKQKVPTMAESPTALFVFANDEDSLFWSLIKSPDEYGWLLRAASSLKKTVHLRERDRQALLLYFKIAKDGFYNSIGRYLLGFLEEDQLLELADTPKKRCEMAYFIGYKAEQEGRFEDASDWYRIAIETGSHKDFEYRWAMTALYKWQSKGVALSRLTEVNIESSNQEVEQSETR